MPNLVIYNESNTISVDLGNTPNTAIIGTYIPDTPSINVNYTDNIEDGSSLSSFQYENVSETYEGMLLGTLSDVTEKFNKINALLNLATRQIESIYIKYKTDDNSGTYWKSKILSGRVFLDEDSLHEKYNTILSDGKPSFLKIGISWDREPYWTKIANETFITLNNPVSQTSGGITTYSILDTANNKYNYVDITNPDNIESDIATPINLYIYNNYANNNRLTDIQMYSRLNSESHRSHYYFSNPAFILKSGTTNGDYLSLDTRIYNIGSISGQMELSTSELLKMKGKIFNILLRGRFTTGTDLKAQIKLTLSSLTKFYESDIQYIETNATSDQIVNFGIIRLPPFDIPNPSKLQIDLHFGGDVTNVELKDILIVPNIYTGYESIGYNIANGVTLKHDGTTDELYTYGWAGGSIANYNHYGSKGYVLKGVSNRFYFNFKPYKDEDRTISVRASYIPRRVAI